MILFFFLKFFLRKESKKKVLKKNRIFIISKHTKSSYNVFDDSFPRKANGLLLRANKNSRTFIDLTCE